MNARDIAVAAVALMLGCLGPTVALVAGMLGICGAAPIVAGALIAATLQEVGCQRYQLHQDLDHPHSWMLYEVWESEAALTAHQGQPHFTEFVAKAEPWFADSTIRRYQPLVA